MENDTVSHVTSGQTDEDIAALHLETALRLTSAAFIQAWISKRPSAPTKRGRRPGAAAAEERCVWRLVGGDQCKNKRDVNATVCRIHASKVHLITDDGAGTGAGGE